MSNISIDTKGKLLRLNLPIVNGDKVVNPPSAMTNKSLTLLWGATGEQEWTPALTTGLLYYILNNQQNEYLTGDARKVRKTLPLQDIRIKLVLYSCLHNLN